MTFAGPTRWLSSPRHFPVKANLGSRRKEVLSRSVGKFCCHQVSQFLVCFTLLINLTRSLLYLDTVIFHLICRCRAVCHHVFQDTSSPTKGPLRWGGPTHVLLIGQAIVDSGQNELPRFAGRGHVGAASVRTRSIVYRQIPIRRSADPSEKCALGAVVALSMPQSDHS